MLATFPSVTTAITNHCGLGLNVFADFVDLWHFVLTDEVFVQNWHYLQYIHTFKIIQNSMHPFKIFYNRHYICTLVLTQEWHCTVGQDLMP